jgi:hypothetical protein
VDPKPGTKTTEFWLTIIAQLIGIAALFGWFTPEQAAGLREHIPAIAGGVIQVFSIFGYSISRGIAKSGKPK